MYMHRLPVVYTQRVHILCVHSFQMLMSNIGKVKYPEYKVARATKIFHDRDALIQ